MNKSDTAEVLSDSRDEMQTNIFAAQVFTARRGFREVGRPPMDKKDI
jgi:hypothetical protein